MHYDLCSRQGWFWLRLSLLLIYLPMASVLPLWLPVVGGAICIWHWRVQQGLIVPPSTLFKVVLVAISAVIVGLTYGNLFSLDVMVTVLWLAVLLKQLEIRQWRDLLLCLYLSFVLLATTWLYDRSLWVTVYGYGCVVSLLASLLVFSGDSLVAGGRERLRRSVILLLQAVPLMVLLFLVVPRLGAFWSVPAPDQAVTGVSAEMSPGDFTRLSKSPEVVMRVSFDHDFEPVPQQLYWRGMTLEYFDGRRWSWRSRVERGLQWRNGMLTPEQISLNGDAVSYAVLLEPHQQRWLFGLPAVATAPSMSALLTDMALYRGEPVQQPIRYTLTSYLDYALDADRLSPDQQRTNLALPAGFNPRSLEMAQRWRLLEGSDDAYIERLLRQFAENFRYTLEPPALGRDSVDEFLFESRLGFCEHFASSFVVMLRAAGIPARVVVGYQGGEKNGDYWIVRQYDAHAWAEAWLPQRGWVRMDPTAHVAPARLEQGITGFNPATGLGSLESYRDIALLNRLRLFADRMNYRWQQLVLNYDAASQLALLQALLGRVDILRLTLLVAAVGGGCLLLIYLWMSWGQRQPAASPSLACYLRLQRKLKRLGFKARASESPSAFCLRVAERCPDLADQLVTIAGLFEQLLYEGADNLPELQRRVRELAPESVRLSSVRRGRSAG